MDQAYFRETQLHALVTMVQPTIDRILINLKTKLKIDKNELKRNVYSCL